MNTVQRYRYSNYTHRFDTKTTSNNDGDQPTVVTTTNTTMDTQALQTLERQQTLATKVETLLALQKQQSPPASIDSSSKNESVVQVGPTKIENEKFLDYGITACNNE